MEFNLTLISPKPVLGTIISPLNPTAISSNQFLARTRKPIGSASISRPRSKTAVFAFYNPLSRRKQENNADKVELFAAETTSVGVNPQPYAPLPPSQIGSPLFWIGVGVGFSALFSFVASRVKNYAMQQAMKTMMGQMGSQNSQLSNTGFPPSSPFSFPPPYTSGPNPSSGFPFPPPPTAGPTTSSGFPYTTPSSTPKPSTSTTSADFSVPSQSPSSRAASEATVAVDISASKVEESEPLEVLKQETERKTEAKQSAFVDVSPDETLLKSPFEDFNGSPSSTVSSMEVVQNGAASGEATATTSEEDTSPGSQGLLSVEALEKMMEDPTVQKMVYPHLPEEMRNPATFKWMLQNPVYRQQLQDMLNNMGGNPQWDNRMVDTLKNFDLSSPQVKQQFDQLGVTPEEVISKIMSTPDLATGFQNPRVQQAMMECSQNPWNITKYQNDKEVMDVINKLSEIFPTQGGPPPF